MPQLIVTHQVSLHAAHSFLMAQRGWFDRSSEAVLTLHPRWPHLEPVGFAILAAWAAWCRREGMPIRVENLEELGTWLEYAARMRLLEHLGIDYQQQYEEHEEAGRFLPLVQVAHQQDVKKVVAEISALLHLEEDPESLAAVQYCISELLRNVLEHSASPEGAFVCAHRYRKRNRPRVTIAVADCGLGIAEHLGTVYPDAATSDMAALGLAMRPGITGARPGLYGTPENAGAGLFITRCIAKGSGGYFLLLSGDAAYRVPRARNDEEKTDLFYDGFDDPRSARWLLPDGWRGTVVSVEIGTDQIHDYEGFFQWIFEHVPGRKTAGRRIRFS
jgi:anti-sigma regulatory factor (Ser/Thr protein kinase)